MSTQNPVRLAIALSLLALSGCGTEPAARANPEPAVRPVALGPARGAACGSFAQPCVLEEIRVAGGAAE